MAMGALFCETAGAVNAKKRAWDSPPRPACTSTATSFALGRRTILSRCRFHFSERKITIFSTNGTEGGLCPVHSLDDCPVYQGKRRPLCRVWTREEDKIFLL